MDGVRLCLYMEAVERERGRVGRAWGFGAWSYEWLRVKGGLELEEEAGDRRTGGVYGIFP
jgi:hypothetical protein